MDDRCERVGQTQTMQDGGQKRRHDGEHCQVCGQPYDDVYWLPDDWWALVTPKPEQPGAGLLCPKCAFLRLVEVICGFGLDRLRDEREARAGGNDGR